MKYTINRIFTPETKLKSLEDTVRFNFFWRLFLVGTLLTYIYTVINYFLFQEIVRYYIIAAGLDSLVLCLLWFYKKYYKWFAVIFSLIIFNILGLALFDNYMILELHILAVLWMIMISILIYFTVNHIFGASFIIGIIVYLSIYYNFYLSVEVIESSLQTLEGFAKSKIFVLSLQMILPIIIIAYTMYQYRVVTHRALVNMMGAMNELKIEKRTVEKHSREKTILLQEIHHRVKNNLQIIISLLRLQSKDLGTSEAKLKFSEAISRIMAMSLIHQKMYEKETLIQINIKDYFDSLIKNLIKVQAPDYKVTLQIDGNLKMLNGDVLIPIGLIINELVSNTLKHAFSNKNSKENKSIKISFNHMKSKTILFTYFDNGIWKHPKTNSFGTELIDIFTEQLDGHYERTSNDEGTTYAFKLYSHLT